MNAFEERSEAGLLTRGFTARPCLLLVSPEDTVSPRFLRHGVHRPRLVSARPLSSPDRDFVGGCRRVVFVISHPPHARMQVRQSNHDRAAQPLSSLKVLGVGCYLLPCATTERSKERNRPLPRPRRRK
jgi:hypothetical protein